MQILIDGQPCDATAGSIGEAIAAGAALAEQGGRRIIEVYADGQLLSGDDLGEGGRLLERADEVRLVSANPTAMSREALLQARDALEEIDSLQQSAAELIQTDHIQDAMEKMLAALGQWQLVQDVMVKSAHFGSIDLESLRADDRPFAEHVADLGVTLRAIAQTLQSGDSLALADILLYEMPDLIARWRALLEQAAALLK